MAVDNLDDDALEEFCRYLDLDDSDVELHDRPVDWNSPSLTSSTGTGSGDNDDETSNRNDASDAMHVCNVCDMIPENGVELNGKHSNKPHGLTKQYKQLREEYFGDTGGRTKAAKNTVSNDWIDREIIDVLRNRYNYEQIRFFVKCENGMYRELFDPEKYSEISKSILKYKGKGKEKKCQETQSRVSERADQTKFKPSEPSMTFLLSESIKAKRSLLRTMQDDSVKIKVYEGVIDNILYAAIEGNLNDEKVVQEMYIWMEETWDRFFETEKTKKRQIVSSSNSNNVNDPDSSGEGKSDSSTKPKKPKGNPDNDYESEQSTHAGHHGVDTSGYATRSVNLGISDDEYDDSTGSDTKTASLTSFRDQHSDGSDDDEDDSFSNRSYVVELNEQNNAASSLCSTCSLQSADKPQSSRANSDVISFGNTCVVVDSEQLASIVIDSFSDSSPVDIFPNTDTTLGRTNGVETKASCVTRKCTSVSAGGTSRFAPCTTSGVVATLVAKYQKQEEVIRNQAYREQRRETIQKQYRKLVHRGRWWYSVYETGGGSAQTGIAAASI